MTNLSHTYTQSWDNCVYIQCTNNGFGVFENFYCIFTTFVCDTSQEVTELRTASKEHKERIANIESVCGIIDKRIPFAKQRREHAANMVQIDLDVHTIMQELLTSVEEMQTDDEQKVFDLNNWFSTYWSNENEEALVVSSDDEFV
jgi:hypothetical protein